MPPVTPDRFVPARALEPLADRFRSTKNPLSLSPAERLSRTESAGPDVFVHRTPRSATAMLPNRRATRSADLGRGHPGTTLGLGLSPITPTTRQISHGTIQAVGGVVSPSSTAVEGDRGSFLGASTNARLYTTTFASSRSRTEREQENHEGRLALALDMDRASRMLDFDGRLTFPRCRSKPTARPRLDQKTAWTAVEWQHGAQPVQGQLQKASILPSAPFKVLDAPGLRDDFYCSIMAYDANSNTLAVGLGYLLYSWDEATGVVLLHGDSRDGSWLTSLAFSSDAGEKSILAFGRSNGVLMLMSMYDGLLSRMETKLSAPVACTSWRPTPVPRKSLNPFGSGATVLTEDLIVGDEIGDIYYYSVEWPDNQEVARDNWSGAITLLAHVRVHSQQICGLAWSTDGDQFATGGNDNLCCLFEVVKILGDTATNNATIKSLPRGSEKHQWRHRAAVKAIAFCPWRRGLLATGGGSNDKCIHFYHAGSGAALATIAVSAQVTSLIWSTTRRELAATFGYAQPDHPYRIAVFSWPDCRQVAAIPWEGEHRALYAISYPGGPKGTYDHRSGQGQSRTAAEGCIVVTSSDESIKFHEIWLSDRKATTGLDSGVLGGSDILEMTEGIDKEGDLIR